MTARLLVPSSALLWGLQSALLSPALALILTTLYGASTTDVGWSLALYNAGGFVAALVIPAWADRRRSYLTVMLASGALTLALAGALALATTLPLATLALLVLGGPASLGTTMLFAHLRDVGARTSTLVNTRAIVSVAWMGGPPLATALIGAFGAPGILAGIAVVALANIGTSAVLRARAAGATGPPEVASADGSVPTAPAVDARSDPAPAPRARSVLVLLLAAFVLFQATNATAMSFLALYVPETLGLPVFWGGITLGVAAALEVPALVLVGRLGERMPKVGLVLLGAVAGVLYYLGLAAVTGPVMLLALQVLNAACFATVSGIGLALFQELIPGPGLSTGIYMNARRVGAVLSGPIIALGALTALEQRGIFLVCAVLTAVGLVLVVLARRRSPAS